jgi:hypothetical protein
MILGLFMVILILAGLTWLLSWVGGWVGLVRWPILVIGALFAWRMIIQIIKLLRGEWG